MFRNLLARVSQWRSRRRLTRHVNKLNRMVEAGASLETLVDQVLYRSAVRSVQIRGEILELLAMVKTLRPNVLGEIGTRTGGTLFLLSQCAAPTARILSVDLTYSAAQQAEFKRFANVEQTIDCWERDSQSPATLLETRQWLGEQKFDFLLIDGDHSYDGVAKDYLQFAPLVRPGGMLVFHDIVADHGTRYGIETESYTGGVPTFWQQACKQHRDTTEIVADREQDGYGLGVIRPAVGETFDWAAGTQKSAA